MDNYQPEIKIREKIELPLIMKRALILAVICLSTTLQALAWGQKGHDVSAYIAQTNLSPKALKKVTAILDNHSLVYYSSWMDSASHTDEYRYTASWHFRNVDKGMTPETMPRNDKGDATQAIINITAQLKKGGLSAKEEKVALMMLIHLLGDMHCPMHAGRLSDRGGNSRMVYFFGSKRNLHSVWDTALIESAHKWSYTEWAEQIDRLTKKEKQALAAGDPELWFKDSYEAAKIIYAATPEGHKISYDYIDEFAPLAERQLLLAGIRLAAILNEIYG